MHFLTIISPYDRPSWEVPGTFLEYQHTQAKTPARLITCTQEELKIDIIRSEEKTLRNAKLFNM